MHMGEQTGPLAATRRNAPKLMYAAVLDGYFLTRPTTTATSSCSTRETPRWPRRWASP